MITKKSHQELLQELITHLRETEVPFYRKEAAVNYFGWHTLVALSIVLSTAASLIAALTPIEQLKEPLIRGLLIALPIFGAAITAFMRSFSFHDRERNRELGAIEVERLLRRAECRLASANTEEQMERAFLELSDQLAELSRDQHALDVATRKGVQVPSMSPNH